MNSDFKDLLQVFADLDVKYLVVGGYAAIHYSQPRYRQSDAIRISRISTKSAELIPEYGEGI